MNKTLQALSITAALAALTLVAQPVIAGESVHKHGPQQNSAERRGIHHHAEHQHDGMDMQKSSAMFLEEKEVDGLMVSFHIMPAKSGMKHGGSHNLMIKVEQDGAALTDIAVNSKIFYADKTTDSKMLMKMGDWYMAGYDLEQAGKHGIMVLFKTSDGEKHKTSIYYSSDKSGE
ncbi:MAG: hypothetical protein Q9M19_07420 [Mariprofundaceae bacterium]|nr:hypothetical protein [Mariprofundaceae bacterium]